MALTNLAWTVFIPGVSNTLILHFWSWRYFIRTEFQSKLAHGAVFFFHSGSSDVTFQALHHCLSWQGVFSTPLSSSCWDPSTFLSLPDSRRHSTIPQGLLHLLDGGFKVPTVLWHFQQSSGKSFGTPGHFGVIGPWLNLLQ